MKCPKCGIENSDSVKFCNECAALLSTPVETVIEETINNDIQLEELKTALKDKYEIIREIGRGGMGIVYECKELSLDRTIALKVLPRELSYDKKFVERFKNEIKILAKIEHPNIVPLISADETGGFIYFTMKYVKGRTLAEIIKDKGELDPKETMRIALQIAQGLSCAHGQNVVHRDLKPENIMLDNNNHLYVMDFGIARALEGTRMTRTGSAIGTPEYMSPEQCSGESEPDGRSDIYSLGVMMYEMLTGIVPFKGESTSVMYQHVHAEPVSLIKLAKNVPIGIINIANSCLEKKPEKRPQGAQDLIALISNSNDSKQFIKKWAGSVNMNLITGIVLQSIGILKRKIAIMVIVVILFLSYFMLYGVKRWDWSFSLADKMPVFYLNFFESTYVGYFSKFHKFDEEYFSRCKRNYNDGNFEKTIDYCTRAIDLGYNDSDAYKYISWAKMEKGDYDGALSELTNAITSNPNNAELYSERARLKEKKNDYDGAISDLTSAITSNPNSAELYSERAQLKEKKNDYDGAISDITDAISKNPNNVELYSKRALLKGKKGDFDSGFIDFNLALKIDPVDSSVYRNRSYIKNLQNNLDGALSDATIAVNIAFDKIKAKLTFKAGYYSSGYYFTPDYYFYNIAISKSLYDLISNALLSKKFYMLKGEDYEKFKVNMPFVYENLTGETVDNFYGDFDALSENYKYRAYCKYQKGDFSDSIDDCNKAIGIYPNDSEAYFYRGLARHGLGDIKGALSDYTRTIDLDSKNKEAYKKRSELKKLKGDILGADQDFEKWKSFK